MKSVTAKYVWTSARWIGWAAALAVLPLIVLPVGVRAAALIVEPPQQVAATGAVAASVPESARAEADTARSAPPSYVIGVDDVLSILFWRDKDLSAPDVTVRPDGKVTLPLLNDVQAAGLSPEQLRDVVIEAARKYVESPNPTVMVKEIKSRKVFITGQVEKPGPYPLNGATTILQLIATAGGLKEFAEDRKSVV